MKQLELSTCLSSELSREPKEIIFNWIIVSDMWKSVRVRVWLRAWNVEMVRRSSVIYISANSSSHQNASENVFVAHVGNISTDLSLSAALSSRVCLTLQSVSKISVKVYCAKTDNFVVMQMLWCTLSLQLLLRSVSSESITIFIINFNLALARALIRKTRKKSPLIDAHMWAVSQTEITR